MSTTPFSNPTNSLGKNPSLPAVIRPRVCFSPSMRKLATLALTALTLACGLTLFGGGDAEAREGNESHGGGTEQIPSTGTAWFLGRDKVIQTCVAVSPGFRMRTSKDGLDRSLSQGEAEALVRDAFSKWDVYLRERGLQAPDAWGHNGQSPGSPEPFPGYATKLAFQSACGTTTDLRVYFGGNDPLVARVKRNYRNPYGVAGTIDDGESRFWQKGLIWLAEPGTVDGYTPQWAPKNLSAVLTHEVGHAYGNSHVPGTVMREDQGARWAVGSLSELPDYIDRIDQERVLYRGTETHRLVTRADAAFQYRLGFSFERLMGRKPVGRIVETLEVSKPKKSRWESGALTLADDMGTKTFSIQYRSPLSCSTVGNGVFWTPSRNSEGRISGSFGTSSVTCMMVGTLKSQEGAEFPIAVSQDGDWRYDIRLTDVEDMRKNSLFLWSPWGDNEESVR